MTPGFSWALLVVLTLDAQFPPPPSWHATRAECEAHAAVRAFHYEVTGRPVAHASCERVRMPQAVRGQTFTPRMEPVP